MPSLTTSYPAAVITLLDVPEPANFLADFRYVYFVPDESLNDRGIPQSQYQSANGNINQISFSRVVPRFNNLSWQQVVIAKNTIGDNEFVSGLGLASSAGNLISAHFSQIQSENSFSNQRFTSINFQDTQIASKLYSLLTGSVAMRQTGGSHLVDMAKILNSLTSDAVPADIIVSGLNQPDNKGVIFIDADQTTQIDQETFFDAKSITQHTQLNNKIIATAVKKIASDSLSGFSQEMLGVVSTAQNLQSLAQSNVNPSTLNSLELESSLVPIDQRDSDVVNFVPDCRVIGYVIDKTELTPNGPIQWDPIVIGSSSTVSYVDTQIKYDGQYVYGIRAIAIFRVSGVNDDTGRLQIVTALLSSKSSPLRTVTCIENVPPPPPADFNIIWDYRKNIPHLMWSFPPNPQRDIKHFQVYKRSRLSEPFELIKHYNFDDSLVKYSTGQFVDPDLIEVMVDPKCFFYDYEFHRDSTVIYAVVSIDAHGLASNYSNQIVTSFDRFRNCIVKRQISLSGCPLPYPNLLVDEEVFLDVIKISGARRATFYFNPDYLQVADSAGADAGFIKYAVDGGSYLGQFINTDQQDDAMLTMAVDDLRSRTITIETLRGNLPALSSPS